MKTQSAPVRTCIGCRKRDTKLEMVRFVAGTDSQGLPILVPDPAGTAPGRGAHLHPTTSCFEAAERKRAFARALRWAGAQPLATEGLRSFLKSLPESIKPTADTETGASAHEPAMTSSR